MASTDSPKSNSEGELDSAPNSSKAVAPSSSPTPTVCLILFAANSACGAFIGSIFGYGAGLVKKKGFKGSFVEARSNAKSFAILSGVESLVVCILARLRRKDDAINAGIAGCCTGLALSFPGIIFIFKTIGAPKDLLQSCLAIGALSFMVEGLNKRQQSLAHPISRKTSMHNNTSPPLALPLQFPLPDEMKGPFSDFYNSLIKCNKRTFPTSR